jgi:hypothetical protein
MHSLDFRQSRRGFIALAGALVSRTRLFGASDFWNKKDPDSWSSEEIVQLSSRSPWAKVTNAVFGSERRGRIGQGGNPNDPNDQNNGQYPGGNNRGGYPGGGGGIGYPGGGVGFPGGGGGGMGRNRGSQGGQRGGEQQAGGVEVTVRWESAEPMRLALKTPLAKEFAAHYVIGVVGLPNQSDTKDEMLDRLKGSAYLQAKGKDAIQPGVVLQAPDGEVLFGFAKEFLNLSSNDKDLQFSVSTGKLSLKVKFEPKEMIYKGQFAV